MGENPVVSVFFYGYNMPHFCQYCAKVRKNGADYEAVFVFGGRDIFDGGSI